MRFFCDCYSDSDSQSQSESKVSSTLAAIPFCQQMRFLSVPRCKKRKVKSRTIAANLFVSFTLNDFLATAIAFPNRCEKLEPVQISRCEFAMADICDLLIHTMRFSYDCESELESQSQ